MNDAVVAGEPLPETGGFRFEDIVSDVQYRTSALSVCNWGMFKGVWTAPIDADGTLICGDTGAGKSTFIDGMQMVLVKPTAARFNTAASGEEARDRTLVTYIRGKEGNTRDGGRTVPKMKRQGATYSAVSTRFEGSDGSTVTLMALFWIQGPSNQLGDVKRVYIVAKRALEIQEVLDVALAERRGIDMAGLEQHYGKEADVTLRTKWDAYEAEFMGVLGIENAKAPALIIKAMGLKEVRNLNNLIREFVLEPGSAYDNARDAVSEFRDLQSVHSEMVDAQAQVAQLGKLEVLKARIDEQAEALRVLKEELDAVPLHVALQASSLLRGRIDELEKQQRVEEGLLADAEAALKAADEAVTATHGAWLDTGGKEIEDWQKEVRELEEQAAIAVAAVNDCLKLAPQLGIEDVGDTLDRDTFTAIREKASAVAADGDAATRQAQSDYGAAYGHAERIQAEKDVVDREIANLSKRGKTSNVRGDYQTLRDALVEAFGIDRDKLVYLAEMVQVPEEHSRLQGAIERALGKSKFTLLVPEADSRQIIEFMNARKLGLDLRIEVVREVQVAPAKFKGRGFLRLLDWRKHPYRDVAKHILSSRDRVVVETVEDLRVTPWAMTPQGLMSYGPGAFEKKDSVDIDDKGNWDTGHDGTSRLQALAARSKEIEADLAQAIAARDAKSSAQFQLQQTVAAAGALKSLTWKDVDVGTLLAERREAEAEIQRLENEDTDLKAAKAKYDKAVEARQVARATETRASTALTLTEESLKRDGQRLDGFTQTIGDRTLDAGIAVRLQQRVEPLTLATLDRSDRVERELRDAVSADHSEKSSELSSSCQSATAVMGAYRTSWPAIAGDLDGSVASIEGYLDILKHIRTDRLVDLEKRFRDKLNHNSLQSLDQVLSAIESQEEDIEARIDDVKAVMNRVEFRPGTRLDMKLAKTQFVEVRDFEHKIDEVRRLATSEDAGARYKALQSVMDDLAFYTDPTRAGNQGTLRLLDARYRLEFSADLEDKETGEVLDTLEGTDGQSGGQRESFSNFIVAASLAYALTPSGGKAPRLSSVFLDEAFSRTSTSMIKSIIAVFKALKLHMNLITPYKELDTSEQATRAVVMVEHDKKSGLSGLKHITWAKFDEIRFGKGMERLPDGKVSWQEGSGDEAA